MTLSRRSLLEQAGSAGLLSVLSACGPAAPKTPAAHDNSLVIGQAPEPLALCSAGSIDGGASVVSVQIFDRLFNTDIKGGRLPKLAVGGELSPDGLTVGI